MHIIQKNKPAFLQDRSGGIFKSSRILRIRIANRYLRVFVRTGKIDVKFSI